CSVSEIARGVESESEQREARANHCLEVRALGAECESEIELVRGDKHPDQLILFHSTVLRSGRLPPTLYVEEIDSNVDDGRGIEIWVWHRCRFDLYVPGERDAPPPLARQPRPRP